MTDQTQAEAAIFEAALGIENPQQRQALLDAACRDDHELRQRIDALLGANDDADDFMQQPAAELSEETTTARPIERPGTRIGRYKLLEQIGEGGFGVVYMADQLEPIKRRVALKIIKLGMDTTQVIARFEAERQALALMEHPNIAKILDAGTTETGRPYFVMELVRGIPVTEYCDDRGLSTEERLNIFMQVCAAVQHAHQKGIIHRDIKPSNVLVSTNGDEAVSMVIDFGIAKATQGRLTDKTLFTQFRQFIGTPAYMSPEQAQMSAVDIDTRSDIYSLGVLLYELMTGKTPLDFAELSDAGCEEICRRIREEEAIAPSKRISSLQPEELSTFAKNRRIEPAIFQASIRGDIDWIAMKAVEKDRARRYPSADAMAEDIERYLHGRPVTAVPPSATYLLRKFVRRNRGWLLTVSFVAATLVVCSLVSTWFAINNAIVSRQLAEEVVAKDNAINRSVQEKQAADQSRQLADTRADELSRQIYLFHLGNADRALLANKYLRARTELLACPQAYRAWVWHHLEERIQSTFPGFFSGSENPIFARDGKWLIAIGASGPDQSRAFVWDISSGERVQTLPHDVQLTHLALSPDEKLLAGGDMDGNLFVWNMETGEKRWSRKLHKKRFLGMDFSPNSRLLVCGNEAGELNVVDATSGEDQFAVPAKGSVRKAMFSPDGRWIAAGSGSNKHAFIVDVSTRDIATRFPDGHVVPTFHPHEAQIATGTRDGLISIWDWDGQELTTHREWQASDGAILALGYSSDGTRLVSSDKANGVKVWDAGKGQQLASMDAQDTPYWLAVAPDGDQVAFFTISGGIRLWRYAGDKAGRIAKPLDGAALARFSPDGRLIAASYAPKNVKGMGSAAQITVRQGKVSVLDAASGKEVLVIDEDLHSATWAPDGRHIVAGVDSPLEVRIYDASTGKPKQTLSGETQSRLASVAASGQQVVSVDLDGNVRQWNLRTGDLNGEFPIGLQRRYALMGVGVSPDNRRIATAYCFDYTVEIWDVHSQEKVCSLPVPQKIPKRIVFSRDGNGVYVGGNGGSLVRLDIRSRQQTKRFIGHGGWVLAIALRPDENQIVSGDDFGRVIVWDVPSGQPLVTLVSAGRPVISLDWSADGRRIVAGHGDGTVQIWTLAASP